MKNLNKKKVLITAGNSVIGNDLVQYFLKNKYLVVETYRKKRNPLKNIKLQHLKYDFNKNFKIEDNFDLLIHCAALTPYKSKMSKKMIKLNFQGLTKILHSKSKFKAIILLSTMSVYGKINSNIVSEKTKKNKIDYYGKSKIYMENYLSKFCKKNKVDYLILRLPGVIGNFISDNNFLNNMIKNFSKNNKVIYKNPKSYFNNVIHTDTISKISEQVIKSKNRKFINQIFNMSSTKPIKLKKIIFYLKKKLKSKSEIIENKTDRSFHISTKKCLKYRLKIISTIASINKTLKYINNI